MHISVSLRFCNFDVPDSRVAESSKCYEELKLITGNSKLIIYVKKAGSHQGIITNLDDMVKTQFIRKHNRERHTIADTCRGYEMLSQRIYTSRAQVEKSIS